MVIDKMKDGGPKGSPSFSCGIPMWDAMEKSVWNN